MVFCLEEKQKHMPKTFSAKALILSIFRCSAPQTIGKIISKYDKNSTPPSSRAAKHFTKSITEAAFWLSCRKPSFNIYLKRNPVSKTQNISSSLNTQHI